MQVPGDRVWHPRRARVVNRRGFVRVELAGVELGGGTGKWAALDPRVEVEKVLGELESRFEQEAFGASLPVVEPEGGEGGGYVSVGSVSGDLSEGNK